MATQFFVTVTGARQGPFKGESTQKGREGKIPGVAFSYGVLSPRDPTSGLPTGKRQHQPVVFSKEWASHPRSSTKPSTTMKICPPSYSSSSSQVPPE